MRQSMQDHPFRFPVHWVNRPTSAFRGFSGTAIAGEIKRGDEIIALPSGQTARIDEIVLFEDKFEKALTDQAVTLTLDREIDLSRGDLISSVESPCEVADQFEAELVWMDTDEGYTGRNYDFQSGVSGANATLSDIKYIYDINSFERSAGKSLSLNEIARVQIRLDKKIPYESYQECPGLGSFILVDRYSNATVAAGMICFGLRRSSNLHRQSLSVDRGSREKLAGHKGKVIWLTGLSGAGKSTIANATSRSCMPKGSEPIFSMAIM